MRKLKISEIIWLSVILLHICFFLIPDFYKKPSPPIKPTPIVVRTYEETPKIAQTKAKMRKPSSSKKKASSQKTKPRTKKPKQRNTQTRKKTSSKQKKRISHTQAKKLLAQLDKSLDSLETSAPTQPEVIIPKTPTLTTLKIESTLNCNKKGQESLFSFFQKHLLLPELPEVKLSITVQPNGKIDTIKILHSKSKRNAEYLVRQLSKLKAPKLSDKSITLTIVFRGE